MVKMIKSKINTLTMKVFAAFENAKAEGYVDSAIKIIIAIVIGTLLLGGLYTLFNTNVIPTITTKITGLFNYTGSNN